MTAIQQLPVLLSANAAFKSNYGKYLRWSMLAAVILMSLLIWLMPRYVPTPYVLREEIIEIIEIEVLQEIKVDEQIAAAPKIVRDVEPVEDWEEVPVEFVDTDIWEPFLPETEYGGGSVEATFMPSSAKPKLLFQAKPEYSQVARMSGLEGTVIVKVLVGPQGKVQAAQVAQGVHPLLNQAAVRAAYKCRFQPGTQRHVPVKAWMAVPYRFRLR